MRQSQITNQSTALRGRDTGTNTAKTMQREITCLRGFQPSHTQTSMLSYKLVYLEHWDMIISSKWTTKALIRLRGCAGWSAPLLFANTIANTAAEILGIMCKLKYTFSRNTLNQIYLSHLLPIFEYASLVWDGCRKKDSNTLQKIQNEAARIVTSIFGHF